MLPGRRGGLPAHVDAATIRDHRPGRFDVIVTDNLFGDIITDLAAAVWQYRRRPVEYRR